MGRAALTDEERAEFRREMRTVATRRFAKHGYAGVTIRALAEDLGVSPMTPYRYFRDKDEIVDEVRLAAAEAFAAAQELAAATERAPLRRLHALARAYVDHARSHPDQYSVMFSVDSGTTPESTRLAVRGWLPIKATLVEAVDRKLLAGDPDELAHLCWAALHGVVTLHLADKLRLGRTLESLVEPIIDHLIAAARPTKRKRSP